MRRRVAKGPILLLLVGLSGLVFFLSKLLHEEEWATNDLHWAREDPFEEPPLFI